MGRKRRMTNRRRKRPAFEAQVTERTIKRIMKTNRTKRPAEQQKVSFFVQVRLCFLSFSIERLAEKSESQNKPKKTSSFQESLCFWFSQR